MAKPIARRPRVPALVVRKENPLVGTIRLLAIICVAYFAAIFFNTLLVRIASLPHGPLWDPAFAGPIFFIMMVIVCGIMAIPFFMKEWDPTLRRFSLYTVLFTVGYAVFDGSGVLDPAFPLKWLVAHVATPLQSKFSH